MLISVVFLSFKEILLACSHCENFLRSWLIFFVSSTGDLPKSKMPLSSAK